MSFDYVHLYRNYVLNNLTIVPSLSISLSISISLIVALIYANCLVIKSLLLRLTKLCSKALIRLDGVREESGTASIWLPLCAAEQTCSRLKS